MAFPSFSGVWVSSLVSDFQLLATRKCGPRKPSKPCCKERGLADPICYGKSKSFRRYIDISIYGYSDDQFILLLLVSGLCNFLPSHSGELANAKERRIDQRSDRNYLQGLHGKGQRTKIRETADCRCRCRCGCGCDVLLLMNAALAYYTFTSICQIRTAEDYFPVHADNPLSTRVTSSRLGSWPVLQMC